MEEQLSQLVPGRFRGPTELMREAFGIFSRRAGTLFAIQAIPLLLSLGTALYLYKEGVISSLTFFQEHQNLFFAAALLYILVTYVCQITLIVAVCGYEERMGVVEAFKKIFKNFLRFLWFGIFFYCVYTAIIVGVSYGLTYIAKGLSAGAAAGSGNIFVVLVYLIAILILVSLLFAAPFIFVTEQIGVIDSFVKGIFYIRKYWGDLVYRLFVGALGVFLALLALAILFGFVAKGLGDNIYVLIIAQFIYIPLGLLIVPFVFTYLFVLYRNLKELKNTEQFIPSPALRSVAIALGFIGAVYLATTVFWPLVRLW
jgi:hypothetical protein